ncbi:MAG TPA: ABC transporter substrate-binding protein [Pirellulales bacterium]|nr:ABC transporter substrate-binding protein [Pirellulales bacterium]
MALVAVGVHWLWAPLLPVDAPQTSRTAPVRIASLTLATDEILSELVPTKRIVCVTNLVDDPEISNVANFYPDQIPRLRDADLERIMAIEPDLVCVASYNSADFLKIMDRAGISLYRNEAYHTLDEIEAGIVALGKCVGEPERAQGVAGRMRSRRAQLADRLRGLSHRHRVLFWSAGFTSGQGTTLDDIIREAGAINVAAENGMKGSQEISPERIIASDPDFIVLANWTADDRHADIKNHPLLRNLRAVSANKTIVIDARYLLCVSQYVVEGAERLARALHPDRFRDAPTSSAKGEKALRVSP